MAERHPSPWAIGLSALMKLEGVGRRSAFKLVEGIESSRDYRDLYDELILRLEAQNTPTRAFKNAWSFAEQELEHAWTSSVRPIAYYDKEYPARLRTIPDPPAIIFVRGNADALTSSQSIAIIGTREPTDYGIKVAKKAARTAVEIGFAVVSGLAHGCDTYAHLGCVESQGIGIGVLAHGLDRVYPAASKELANELLLKGGCLVSEYPMGVKPYRNFFAERDRIQSGLSDAILVIETDIKGGTMHTVRFAAAQRRKIACISHPNEWLLEEKTRGNQELIRSGRAIPIGDGASLAEFLGKLGSRKDDAPKAARQLGWQF